MPVPRRFDRQPPERDTTRINERIRVPQVRLIGADGEQLGIVDTPEALKRAQDADLGAGLVDQAHLGYADAIVDPGGVSLGETPVETAGDRH